MKKLLAASAILLSFAPAAFAESLTGIVADAMCAKNPSKITADHAACAAKCIKGGSPAVLVVGEKVYKVSNPDKLTPFAGEKVTVDAKIDNDTLTVDSVKPLASSKQ